MRKKFILPGILTLVIVLLFLMYKKQRRMVSQNRESTHQLVSQLNQFQDENSKLKKQVRDLQRERAAVHTERPTFVSQQKYYRQNWNQYIQADLTDYHTGLLGGISEVKIKLTNKSRYPIDKAVVLVRYFLSKGSLFKTEKVTFNQVVAEGSREVSAPRSRRGMSVTVELIQVHSSGMNFCWSAEKQAKAVGTDPFRCVTSND